VEYGAHLPLMIPTVHPPEEMLGERLPIGPPALFAEKLTAFASAGVQRVFIWPVADEVHGSNASGTRSDRWSSRADGRRRSGSTSGAEIELPNLGLVRAAELAGGTTGDERHELVELVRVHAPPVAVADRRRRRRRLE
jgi:hypothetical protein